MIDDPLNAVQRRKTTQTHINRAFSFRHNGIDTIGAGVLIEVKPLKGVRLPFHPIWIGTPHQKMISALATIQPVIPTSPADAIRRA